MRLGGHDSNATCDACRRGGYARIVDLAAEIDALRELLDSAYDRRDGDEVARILHLIRRLAKAIHALSGFSD